MKIFDESLLKLRPCLISDKEFVYQTKKITMKPYVKEIWGEWNEEFQRGRFDTNFNVDNTQIVQYSDVDIGVLIIEENTHAIQVDNIQLIPEYQNRGIGSFLLITLIKNAMKVGKSVTLQVLKSNSKAKNLYERLGFNLIKETEFHFQMKRI